MGDATDGDARANALLDVRSGSRTEEEAPPRGGADGGSASSDGDAVVVERDGRDPLEALFQQVIPLVQQYFATEDRRIQTSERTLLADAETDKISIQAELAKAKIWHSTVRLAIGAGLVLILALAAIFARAEQLEMFAANLKEMAALIIGLLGTYAYATGKAKQSQE
jgi:hypothetical protein